MDLKRMTDKELAEMLNAISTLRKALIEELASRALAEALAETEGKNIPL
jgi:aspartate/tyrosine/aromatic aminotransferase